MIRAILIDPFACEVKHVEFEGGDYKAYYPLLSHPTMPVDTFTASYTGAALKGHDVLFVDDEGLLKQCERFFILAGAHQPFAGKGLIVGADSDGDAISAETSLDIVRMSVMFAEVIGGRLAVTRTPWEPQP